MDNLPWWSVITSFIPLALILGTLSAIVISKGGVRAWLRWSLIFIGLFAVFFAVHLLTGCAARQPTFSRIDGGLVDENHMRATLAQCRGQAATIAVTGATGISPNLTLQQQGRMVEGCMAQHGYLRSDQ